MTGNSKSVKMQSSSAIAQKESFTTRARVNSNTKEATKEFDNSEDYEDITGDDNYADHDNSNRYTAFLDFLLTPKIAIAIGIIERIIIFFWGLYQDAVMEPRFTDIDYFVFTDASRFMRIGLLASKAAAAAKSSASSLAAGVAGTPYERETYRYTPLLAWLLLPTANWFFSFGKVLFAIGDIIAGILILQILIKAMKVPTHKAVLYTSAVWLWNPMVSIISTRGSSEGLLGAIVMALLYAVSTNRLLTAGLVAGFAVHFKIYPIIYIPTVIWSLSSNSAYEDRKNARNPKRNSIFPSYLAQKSLVLNFVNWDRIIFGLTALASFVGLTYWMYVVYGTPFLQHTYFHHFSRIDHRHNFSPYSTLLYMASSPPATALSSAPSTANYLVQVLLQPQLWAFFPQLFLSGFLLPLLFAKRDVPKTMFLQTFAFVTFNKVCTAQYFMWYMVLLPFYLPSLIAYLSPEPVEALGKAKKPQSSTYGVLVGLTMAGLWFGAQALWVRQGYLLEFLGISTFYPGLFISTLVFFVVNCLCLGLFIRAM